MMARKNMFLALFVLGALSAALAAPLITKHLVEHGTQNVQSLDTPKSVRTTIVEGLDTLLAGEDAGVPGASHYGDPYLEDCMSNEVNITIVGVTGAMCSPSCAMLDSCPKDVPKGVTAKPTCALQDMAGHKYCALVCALKLPETPYQQGLADVQCGVNASCKAIGTVGICTYDS